MHRRTVTLRPPQDCDRPAQAGLGKSAQALGSNGTGDPSPQPLAQGPKRVVLTAREGVAGTKPRCLHLFSGRSTRIDGLSSYLRRVGWEVDDYDIVNGPSQDLTADHIWEDLKRLVSSGHYDFVFFGTPCETFSRARTGPPGPRPLRDALHLYGLPKDQLTYEEHTQVRTGTYFAVQTAALAQLAYERDVGFAVENPEPWGEVSLFALEEFARLSKLPGVLAVNFDQCEFGAITTKPTRILYFGADLAHLERRCSHEPQWHCLREARSLRWYWGAHAPLRGKDQRGCWRTTAAAAYLAQLNLALARGIVARGRHTLPSLTGPAKEQA